MTHDELVRRLADIIAALGGPRTTGSTEHGPHRRSELAQWDHLRGLEANAEALLAGMTEQERREAWREAGELASRRAIAQQIAALNRTPKPGGAR